MNEISKSGEYIFDRITFSVTVDRDSCILRFGGPVPVLSTCVLGGGMAVASSVLNLRVQQNYLGLETEFLDPAESLVAAIADASLPFPCAGMMTAASMNSFRDSVLSYNGVRVFCCLTAGLSNAIAAGEDASYLPEVTPGTINIIAGTNIPLSPQSACEAMMICTEAKAALIREKEIKSRYSDNYATGTGTDSILIFSPPLSDDCPVFSPDGEKYCGKHTKLGELFARVVKDALGRSIDVLK